MLFIGFAIAKFRSSSLSLRGRTRRGGQVESKEEVLMPTAPRLGSEVGRRSHTNLSRCNTVSWTGQSVPGELDNDIEFDSKDSIKTVLYEGL